MAQDLSLPPPAVSPRPDPQAFPHPAEAVSPSQPILYIHTDYPGSNPYDVTPPAPVPEGQTQGASGDVHVDLSSQEEVSSHILEQEEVSSED